MDIPNNFYRTSAKALILNGEGKFLLCHEDNGWWDLPGGAIDFGESIENCLKRELKEELNFEVTKVEKTPINFITFLNRKGIWFANVLYKVEASTENFVPSDECTEFKYFSVEEALKENVFESVKEIVSNYDLALKLRAD